MILHHFSPKSMPIDTSRGYIQKSAYAFKPVGLWLSDESADVSWSKWCKGQNFNLKRLTHCTSVLCDVTKWVVLDTVPKILKFSKKYMGEGRLYLKWEEVAKDYSGILISPYQWSLRFDPRAHWYYSWDCASACVWDLSTIIPLDNNTHLPHNAKMKNHQQIDPKKCSCCLSTTATLIATIGQATYCENCVEMPDVKQMLQSIQKPLPVDPGALIYH